MTRPSTSRRRLLKCGAAIGTATLAGLAGCSAADPGLLDWRGEPLAYATWLPAPATVFRDPVDAEDRQGKLLRSYYPFAVTDWSAVGDRLAVQGREAASQIEAEGDDYETEYEDGHVHPVLPVGPDEAGLEVYSNRGLSVLETGIDDGAVVAAFESHRPETGGFERAGEYEGWEMLTLREGAWTVAVRDGVVVEGFRSTGFGTPLLQGTRKVVEGVIDARAGEQRYVDTDDDLGTLVSHLGHGAYVTGSTRPAGRVADEGDATAGTATATGRHRIRATGEATTLGADGIRSTYAAVFESSADASVERVARNGKPWHDWEDVETKVDGRVVVAEGARPDFSL
jgi:hypothetical protein